MRRASISAEMALSERRASITSIDQERKPSDAGSTEDANNNEAIIDLTPVTALALVQPFFPNEWGKITGKDVTVKTIT